MPNNSMGFKVSLESWSYDTDVFRNIKFLSRNHGPQHKCVKQVSNDDIHGRCELDLNGYLLCMRQSAGPYKGSALCHNTTPKG